MEHAQDHICVLLLLTCVAQPFPGVAAVLASLSSLQPCLQRVCLSYDVFFLLVAIQTILTVPSVPAFCSIEYNVSYVYHALYAYFDRDNVGLPGFAAYFKAASEEEREHAEVLMKYQNVRGGRVRLSGISIPEMEFNHADKVRARLACSWEFDFMHCIAGG